MTINKVITLGAVNGLPSALPGFSIVSMWSHDKNDLEMENSSRVRYRLKTPSKTVAIANIDIDHVENSNINRVILELKQFPVQELGSYSIIIDKHTKNRWKNVASIPFLIIEKSKSENKT